MDFLRELSNQQNIQLPYIDPILLNTANNVLNTSISVGTTTFSASQSTYPRIDIKSQIVDVTSCLITTTYYPNSTTTPKIITKIIGDDIARSFVILAREIPFENE